MPLQDGQYEGTITRLIESVTRQVESYIKQDIVKKNIESMWFQVPSKAILSRGPHTDISSVTVTDHNGNVTTLSSDQYTIRGMLYKQITHIQKGGELRVTYVSGYEPDAYPIQIRDAIMQEISLQFKNRQDPDTPAMTSVNNLSLEARHLLASIIRLAL